MAIRPLVFIGIPSYGMVRLEWAYGMRSLALPLGSHSSALCHVDSTKNIAQKRNELVERALEINARNLFFLGDDVIAPPETLVRLLNLKKDIVGGVYFAKCYPPMPVLFRGVRDGPYYDWHVGELIQVDWMGCDCVMVNMEVFKHIPPPWFSLDYRDTGNEGPASIANTEDLYFYAKAKRHGYTVWADTSLQCAHVERDTGIVFALPQDWPQHKANLPTERGNKLIADLGCGQDTPYYIYKEGTVVRFDQNEVVKPDVRCDIRNIPQPDQKFDGVVARHVLEHFPFMEAEAVLKEWIRILKVGGWFRIEVPDLAQAMQAILQDRAIEYNWLQLYGKGDELYGVHRAGYVERTLKRLLEGAGLLKDIEVKVDGLNLVATAIKSHHPPIISVDWTEDGTKQEVGVAHAQCTAKGHDGDGNRPDLQAAGPVTGDVSGLPAERGDDTPYPDGGGGQRERRDDGVVFGEGAGCNHPVGEPGVRVGDKQGLA